MAQDLAAILDGRHAQVRRQVRERLIPHAGLLREADELPREAYRERIRELLLEMTATGLTGLGFPEEYGGGGDVGASIAAFETLAMGDLSLLVKSGVQFGLFGGAILQLGTKRHHDAYLADVGHAQIERTGHVRADRHAAHVLDAARHRHVDHPGQATQGFEVGVA